MGGKQSKSTSEQNGVVRLDIGLFAQLPDVVINSIGREWLTRREAVLAEKVVRVHHGKKLRTEQRPQITLFKSILTETEAAYAVLTASPERLLRILTQESCAQDIDSVPDKTSIFLKSAVKSMIHSVKYFTIFLLPSCWIWCVMTTCCCRWSVLQKIYLKTNADIF